MDVTDLRRVQARLGDLPRGEQAAMALAIAEALGPLAELGEQVVASADVARLLGGARSAIESVSLVARRQLLAEAEAMPVMAAREEPPGNAVFAVDVLACLVYAIKTMTEPEPARWSGYCIQRACDCLFFAGEALARPGGPARLQACFDAIQRSDAATQVMEAHDALGALKQPLLDRMKTLRIAFGPVFSEDCPYCLAEIGLWPHVPPGQPVRAARPCNCIGNAGRTVRGGGALPAAQLRCLGVTHEVLVAPAEQVWDDPVFRSHRDWSSAAGSRLKQQSAGRLAWCRFGGRAEERRSQLRASAIRASGPGVGCHGGSRSPEGGGARHRRSLGELAVAG